MACVHTAGRPPAARPGGGVRRWAATAALAVAWVAGVGCTNDAFSPPPPPELNEVRSTLSATSPDADRAPKIALVLANQPNPDHETYILAGRQEAGRRKVILQVEQTPADGPAAAEADLIRKAARDPECSALIVEPGDDPTVVEALNDVRAGGKPVVLLTRPLRPRDPAAAFGLIRFEPFEPIAREVVGQLDREAKTYGMPAGAHALLARNTRYGPWFEPYVATLATVLKEAGFAEVTVVPFDGTDEAAQAALNRALDADPKAAVLFASEDVGMSAALAVHDKAKSRRTTYVGGYMTIDRTMNAGFLTRTTVIVDRNIPTFIIEAIRMASSLARGEPVALEKIVPTPVHLRTTGPKGVQTPKQ